MGRRTKETVYRESDEPVVKEYYYDAMGRLIQAVEDAGEGKLNLTTTYTYDGHGLLETVTNQLGTVTKYEYDHRNRLSKVIEDYGTGRANLTTEYAYDGNGNKNWQKNANDGESWYAYNVRNQLTWSRDAGGYETYYDRDALGNVLRRERCLAGRPTASQPASSCPEEGGSDVIAYEYTDALGRLTKKIVAPDTEVALTTSYAYPASQCGCGGAGGSVPSMVVDPAGRTTHRKFDLLGRVTQVRRQVGQDAGCDSFESCADLDDAITWYFYDPEGNLEKVIGPDWLTNRDTGETTIYTYSATGRIISERKLLDPPNTGNGDLETSFFWDEVGNLTYVGLPNGYDHRADYDGAGRLLHVYDGAGPSAPVLAAHTYDAGGNVRTRADGLGRTWEYQYDALGRVMRESDPIVESPDKYTTHQYDGVGNLVLTVNNNGVRTEREYDALSRLTKVIEDEGSTSTPTNNTTTEYVYDGSRMVALEDHDGNTTTYAYDAVGRVTAITYPPCTSQPSGDQGPCQVQFEHYSGGSIVYRTDQREITTSYVFDGLGRLGHRSYPTRTEDFAFDLSGRLTSATSINGDNQVVFEWQRSYDKLGRPAVETQSFREAGSSSLTQYSTTFAYAIDAQNHTTSWTMTTPPPPGQSVGRPVRHTLDRLNRLVEAAMLDDQSQTLAGATWTHDAAGQRVSATLANGVHSAWDYDADGRMNWASHVRPIGGQMAEILFDAEYGYDAVGNRTFTRQEFQPERGERYGYDNLNRLTLMERGELNEAGSAVVTPLSHPTLASNQQWANLDRRGNWLDYRWAMTQTEGDPPAQTSTAYRQTRVADGVNEYTAIDPDGPPAQGQPANQPAVTPVYDEAGNLTLDLLAVNAGDPGGGVATTQPCGTGVLAGASPSSVGLPACPTGQLYEYDEENRVVAVYQANGTAATEDDVLLARYQYDALGRRVVTQESFDTASEAQFETRHVYVGLETIQEYQCVGQTACEAGDYELVREFLWGDVGRFPEPVAMVWHYDIQPVPPPDPPLPPVEEVFHYLHDVLGSVVGLTDSTGALVERYTYDPYGKPFVETSDGLGGWTAGGASVVGNPWLWTAQRYDAATGLYAFLCRSYSPALGRWLQRDPEAYVDGVNLYQYVMCNPLGWIDPWGLDSVGFADCGDGSGPNGGNNQSCVTRRGRDFFDEAAECDWVFCAGDLEDIKIALEILRSLGITIDSIRIVDHGNSKKGQELGDHWINPDDPHDAKLLREIGGLIDEGGEIELTGCNIAGHDNLFNRLMGGVVFQPK